MKNKKEVIYKKGQNIIILNLTSGNIELGNLIEDVSGLMPDKRRRKIEERYDSFGEKYIFFSKIGDLYENYILEKTGFYDTNKLRSHYVLKKVLKKIIGS